MTVRHARRRKLARAAYFVNCLCLGCSSLEIYINDRLKINGKINGVRLD